MTTTYDLIVIGAGAVGENVADRAVQRGLTAVIIEKELVGGECSYWACMPSKALLRTGIAMRAGEKVGVRGGTLDPTEVFARRDSFTSEWQDDGQVKWLDKTGIALVRGHARLTAERRVAVTADDGSVTHLVATHAVVISTGSAALMPDIPGLSDARPWSSREATSATRVPDRIAIIGGGVVALEMATAYQTLGAAVTATGDLSAQGIWSPAALTDGRTPLGIWQNGGRIPSEAGDSVAVTNAGETVSWMIALDQAAPLADWKLPEEFATLRRLLEARMGKSGKREFVQVLRLMEVFKVADVAAAVRDAIARGAVGFDAVKHLVLCRIERRPPRLDMTIYPYLPKATVATTSARSYMDLLAGVAT